MAIVDPWGGMKQGTQTLGRLAAMETARRQQQAQLQAQKSRQGIMQEEMAMKRKQAKRQQVKEGAKILSRLLANVKDRRSLMEAASIFKKMSGKNPPIPDRVLNGSDKEIREFAESAGKTMRGLYDPAFQAQQLQQQKFQQEKDLLKLKNKQKDNRTTEIKNWEYAQKNKGFQENLDKGAQDRTFKQKIAQLRKVYGLSEQEASGLVIGTKKIIADEVSGTRYLVDSVKGTEKKLKPAEMSKKKPEKKTDMTIWKLSDEGTGPISALKSGASTVSGMAGGPIAEETVQARQFIQSAQNDLVRALSINPRYPVNEINRIREEINISPTFFDNPEQLRQRAIAVDSYLRQRIENEKTAGNDDSLPRDSRRAARSAAKDISNFLNFLGVPPKITDDDAGRAKYKALPSGSKYLDPQGKERTKK